MWVSGHSGIGENEHTDALGREESARAYINPNLFCGTA